MSHQISCICPDLKRTLESIVLDESLTKEERGVKLVDEARTWLGLCRKVNERLEFPEDELLDYAFEIWNLTMAEIVKENNLGRH